MVQKGEGFRNKLKKEFVRLGIFPKFLITQVCYLAKERKFSEVFCHKPRS